MTGQPLLSIGLIFKNEIRCIERCMKALAPLREAIPCELVMADTGSDDGSRAVAERYADILFDFPWIDDFAAARNAVMDRCSGKWFMSIDCDEWLDENTEELVRFLTRDHQFNHGMVKIRNYTTKRFDEVGGYDDFFTARLILMSTGRRFIGAIHENWALEEMENPSGVVLQNTVFHHDGYVRGEEYNQKCKERNQKLIKKEMEVRPDDLVLLMQFLDSAQYEEQEFPVVAAHALECIERKVHNWNLVGAPVIRTVAQYYYGRDKERCSELLDLLEEKFPDSLFTKLDGKYLRLATAYSKGYYEKVVALSGEFFAIYDEFKQKKIQPIELGYSTLFFGSKTWKNVALVFVANSYLQLDEYEACRDVLQKLDGDLMEGDVLKNALQTLQWLYCQSDLDVSELICWVWEQIQAETLEEERLARERLFVLTSSLTFSKEQREAERQNKKFRRPAWELYAALKGKAEVGNGAALELAESAAEAENLMKLVKDWAEVPIQGLAHALCLGADVPRVDAVEAISALVGRLGVCPEMFPGIVHRLEEMGQRDLYHLLWARGLGNAALQVNDWEDGEYSMCLCRTFIRLEEQYLNCYYNPAMLREENLFALAPVDRFSWYGVRAFAALDQKDQVSFTSELRKGLHICPSMKDMVKFLVNQVRKQAIVTASPELLALAEQVKTVLAMYPADDPAVLALKQTPAYQQVAFLIEEPRGLMQ